MDADLQRLADESAKSLSALADVACLVIFTKITQTHGDECVMASQVAMCSHREGIAELDTMISALLTAAVKALDKHDCACDACEDRRQRVRQALAIIDGPATGTVN
jgi:hypothetical protein